MSFTGEPLTCFDQETRIRLTKMLLLEIERDRLHDALRHDLAGDPIPDINIARAIAEAMPERRDGEDIGDWLRRGIQAGQV